MLDQKLVDFVNQFRSFNLNDDMNLINIFQQLSTNFPKSLPLDADEVYQAIAKHLANLGYDIKDITKDHNESEFAKSDYKWPHYHHQLKLTVASKDITKLPFIAVTFDKSHMALVFESGYQEHPELFMDLDDTLLNLLVLYVLCDKQNNTLNQDILKYSAKLIYVQQSDISIKIDDETKVQELSVDFGKDTNMFLSNFQIPEGEKNEDLPDIRILDLIKYMSDVINGRPVDSSMFNLIAQGLSLNNGTNRQIIINQAKQLGLTNILTKMPGEELSKLKHALSPEVAKKVKNAWIINNQKPNNTKAHHKLLVHGTKNLSVLNILGEGLLDHITLNKKKSTHYNFTGDGLGNGIYFARLDQADKSYNYTGSAFNQNMSAYMFVADVAYNKIHETQSYNPNIRLHKGEDLVWGKAVGSYDRDEIVAQNADQVQLKYLLELA